MYSCSIFEMVYKNSLLSVDLRRNWMYDHGPSIREGRSETRKTRSCRLRDPSFRGHLMMTDVYASVTLENHLRRQGCIEGSECWNRRGERVSTQEREA